MHLHIAVHGLHGLGLLCLPMDGHGSHLGTQNMVATFRGRGYMHVVVFVDTNAGYGGRA